MHTGHTTLLMLSLTSALTLLSASALANTCPAKNMPIRVGLQSEDVITGRFDAASSQDDLFITIYRITPGGFWEPIEQSPSPMLDAGGNWFWHPSYTDGFGLPTGYFAVEVSVFSFADAQEKGSCPLFFVQVGQPPNGGPPVNEGWGDSDRVYEEIYGVPPDNGPDPGPGPGGSLLFTGCPEQPVATVNPAPSFLYTLTPQSRVDIAVTNNRNNALIFTRQVPLGANGVFQYTLDEDLSPGAYTISLTLFDNMAGGALLDSCTYEYKVDELQYERCATSAPGAPTPGAPLLALGLLAGVMGRRRRARR